MASKLDVYNLAIYKLAQSVGIPTLADRSKAADVFNRLYDPMRQLVLTERVWPWSLRAAALAPAAEAPQPPWAYRYQYPNDCLTAMAVLPVDQIGTAPLSSFADEGYMRNIAAFSHRWEMSYGEDGTTINCSGPNAWLVYAVDVQDESRFSPHFVNCLATRMAAEAGPPIIGEAGLNNKSQLLQEYTLAMSYGGAHASNQSSTSGEDYVTPSLAARGG